MGHHSAGCRVLDGDEDTAEMVAGLGIAGILGLLSYCCGASGREGAQGQGWLDRGSSESLVEQSHHAVLVFLHKSSAAEVGLVPTESHSDS